MVGDHMRTRAAESFFIFRVHRRRIFLVFCFVYLGLLFLSLFQ
jgi:hypothetical protein